MLYIGVGDSPAILINYHPAGKGSSTDDAPGRVRRFAAGRRQVGRAARPRGGLRSHFSRATSGPPACARGRTAALWRGSVVTAHVRNRVAAESALRLFLMEVRMARFVPRALCLVLLAAATACSGYYGGAVSITKSESLVSGCQKGPGTSRPTRRRRTSRSSARSAMPPVGRAPISFSSRRTGPARARPTAARPRPSPPRTDRRLSSCVPAAPARDSSLARFRDICGVSSLEARHLPDWPRRSVQSKSRQLNDMNFELLDGPPLASGST